VVRHEMISGSDVWVAAAEGSGDGVISIGVLYTGCMLGYVAGCEERWDYDGKKRW